MSSLKYWKPVDPGFAHKPKYGEDYPSRYGKSNRSRPKYGEDYPSKYKPKVRTSKYSRNFSIPRRAYPSSGSSSIQRSESAIDWTSGLGQTLLPLIRTWAKKVPGIAQDMGQTLQDQYNSLMRSALQPQAFQGVLNQLANRGVLDSSITKDALSDTASRIAQKIGEQGYLSVLEGLQAQMGVPQILSKLAELARSAKTQAVSQSEYSNPLAPYELMARMMMY